MSHESALTVVVTGGTGFLGSQIVKSYLESGARVRALSRRGIWIDDGLPQGLDVVEVDLRDRGRLDLFEGVDLVIHAAGVTDGGNGDPTLLKQMNVAVTRNVIDACRNAGVPRLLHVSSTATIGISPDPRAPAHEGFAFNLDHLNRPYSFTKREAEKLALDANSPGLRTVVVNPGFIFGPYKEGFRGQEVIERVARRRVVLCTRGGLSIVHVEDVVDGIRKVLDHGRAGHRYILSGDNISFCGIARTIVRIARCRTTVIPVPDAIRDLAGRMMQLRIRRDPAAHVRLFLDPNYAYAYYSSDIARTELGFAPRPFAAIAREALTHMGFTNVDPASGT